MSPIVKIIDLYLWPANIARVARSSVRSLTRSNPPGNSTTQADLVSALRRHFARHNRAAFGFALLTFLTTAALWALLYFFTYWVLLFVITFARGLDAEMPVLFRQGFLLAGVASLALAWIDRRLRPHERLTDRKSAGVIAIDILLAIPRVTLAIGGNLSAWQHLDAEELSLAAALCERVALETRVEFRSALADIPRADVREKIIFALLLCQVLELRREEGITWLRQSASWHNYDPATLSLAELD